MRKDHRGFTLAELLVVVAILGVCVAIVTMSSATALSARARKCAIAIDASLTDAKVAALSRVGDNYLALYARDGKIYADLHTNGEVQQEVVGSSGVSVTYTAGGTVYTLGEDPLYLAFERKTGALLSLQAAADLAGAEAPDAMLSAVTVTRGRSYVITVVSATGYHGIGG